MNETSRENSSSADGLRNVYDEVAVAYVRGRCAQGAPVNLNAELRETRITELSPQQKLAIYDAGRNAGLRLHKFKRTPPLARVNRVLGAMQSISPQNLLDVGSGRGAFLWPLLDAFPELIATAIDAKPQRASDLQAIRIGGVERLTAHQMDVANLQMHDKSFDVVTVLEVLEHVPNYSEAVREVVRVARRFVITSVPAKPDENPEHIHLLTRDRLEVDFRRAGCRRIRFDSVLNHLVAFATIA